MPVLFEYKCQDCGWSLRWIYDEEEDRFRTDSLTGCPGDGCTRIHDVSARRVDEDKAAEMEERGHTK